jgi:hypothetical protein
VTELKSQLENGHPVNLSVLTGHIGKLKEWVSTHPLPGFRDIGDVP